MSIARCLRALAFFSINALSAGFALGETSAVLAKSAELEAGLASTREVYLVFGVESHDLAIRVRGVTLEQFPVSSLVAYEQRRLTDSSDVGKLEVPRVFVTAATVSLIDRKVVAPDALKPWNETAETGTPLTKAEDRPVPPSEYDVPLEGGWILEVRQDAIDPSRSGRFVAALVDGWQHLRREGPRDRAPRIRVVMDEVSAGRINHLFKRGTSILLVKDSGFRDRARR